MHHGLRSGLRNFMAFGSHGLWLQSHVTFSVLLQLWPALLSSVGFLWWRRHQVSSFCLFWLPQDLPLYGFKLVFFGLQFWNLHPSFWACSHPLECNLNRCSWILFYRFTNVIWGGISFCSVCSFGVRSFLLPILAWSLCELKKKMRFFRTTILISNYFGWSPFLLLRNLVIRHR